MNPYEAFQTAKEYLKAGRIQNAIDLFTEILKDQPDNFSVLHLLGIMYYQLKNYDRAIEYSQKALDLNPSNADAFYNLGNAFREKKAFVEAIAYYKKVLEINPQHGDAYYNLGTIYQDENRIDEAIACYNEALQINPSDIDASFNLGNVFRDKGQFEEAISHYKKAIDRNPHLADAYNNLGTILLETGHFDGAERYYKRAIDAEPQNVLLRQNSISSMLYNINHNRKTICSEHLHFAQWLEKSLAASIPPHTNAKKTNRRLRIGYVSPDFRRHSVAYYIQPVIAAHNRGHIEVFCYYTFSSEDEMTKRVQSYANRWRNISAISDEEATALIRQDEIDILVDLAGYSSNSRISLFAHKPAPVQVTWIGYPATTGLSTMDYKIVDNYTDPPGMTEQFYTEKLVRMPDSFLCYLPYEDSPGIKSLPCLSSGHITFGSLNNFSKISPVIIDLWASILIKIPGARLLMKAKALSDRSTREYAIALFNRKGIQKDRLELLSWEPLIKTHLQTYNRIDIGLDTFPYNGTTTTCEALWMGVPVITLSGDVHASRVGASLLSNMGLKDLVAKTSEEYVETAVRLTCDVEKLHALRNGLRNLMAKSPLMNAQQFTHNLENCYNAMWQTWCKSS